ncbi:MAG: hypothetical protein V1900_00105 [Candidatus Aenigmatarchaeota archaeon]
MVNVFEHGYWIILLVIVIVVVGVLMTLSLQGGIMQNLLKILGIMR